MKKLLYSACAAALITGAFWVRAVAAAEEDLGGQIDGIATEIARLTGLKQLRKIEYARIGKDEVKGFLEERVKESVKPEEIRAEEVTLKKFGLAPADFDLKKTMIDLLSEQAAAFYEFRKKKLFIIDSGSDVVQHSALVHEVAHALADQTFHLQKFIDAVKHSDDASLARMAVMEGQATWITAEYLTQKTGQSLKTSPALVKLWTNPAEMSADQFPAYSGAPLYLRENLMFPYTQGMLFQHAVVEKLDKAAFAEVFRHPPENSQQVMHPERYLAHTKSSAPALPDLASERGYRTLTDGTFGEFDHSILLRQYGGAEEAQALAPEWRGGQYRVLENKDEGRLVLLYASEWATADDAARYFRFYRGVLSKKWKRFEPSVETADRVSGLGDDGYFVLRREGARVASIEGMRAATDARRDAAAAAIH